MSSDEWAEREHRPLGNQLNHASKVSSHDHEKEERNRRVEIYARLVRQKLPLAFKRA